MSPTNFAHGEIVERLMKILEKDIIQQPGVLVVDAQAMEKERPVDAVI